MAKLPHYAVLAWLLSFAVAWGADAIRIPLSATPSVLVHDEVQYRSFALGVVAHIDPASVSNWEPDTAKLAYTIAVHHYLHDGNCDQALRAAEALRGTIPPGAGRELAGLLTRAYVFALRSSRRQGETFRNEFASEFRRLLADLAPSAELRQMLQFQREKYQEMSSDSIKRAIAELDARIGVRREISLAEADQIIRLRHRLADLLPLRTEIISELEGAIDRLDATLTANGR